MNVIELDELVKTYDTGHRALDNLSLRVPAGAIFGFIGLNGAGKTSTIRIMAGLSLPENGTARVLGVNVAAHDGGYRRECGFVLDEPLYFEWMSAFEYLRFAGLMYGLPESVADGRSGELLDFFDLNGKGDDPIGTFSTGMKKKVSLAAAIIHKPRLIVLDEPFEGIDAVAGSAIKECLAMMAANGATIFITSHVLDTVEKFCTEIAILHEGRLLLQCATDDIRRQARGKIEEGPYESLEELFVDLVAGKATRKRLTYI